MLMHPLDAETLGYKLYPEFRIEDESTYTSLCKDAQVYFMSDPIAMKYYCWVPQYGAIYIKREALGGDYAVA